MRTPTIAKFGVEARDDKGNLFSQSCNIDDELAILNEVFAKSSINLSKANPSGTNDHQASDVSSNVRDLKTG